MDFDAQSSGAVLYRHFSVAYEAHEQPRSTRIVEEGERERQSETEAVSPDISMQKELE